jgi:threonine-phosphate decarboxylase
MIRTLTTAWENGFQPTVYQLETLIEAGHPQAVFLTSPGSPSGIPLPSDVRDFVKNYAEKSDLLWIIDEVFCDFCEEYSMADLARSLRNLIVIRSLTKFYALPGLRLGYALGHRDLIVKLRRSIPPWSVNTFAQEAGCYCLNQKDFREKTLEFFRNERERVFELLEKIPGISFLKTAANYVLIQIDGSPGLSASSIQTEFLKKYRILIRNCANFRGLSDKFIRVAIASPEINDLWLRALREVVSAEAEP